MSLTTLVKNLKTENSNLRISSYSSVKRHFLVFYAFPAALTIYNFKIFLLHLKRRCKKIYFALDYLNFYDLTINND